MAMAQLAEDHSRTDASALEGRQVLHTVGGCR